MVQIASLTSFPSLPGNEGSFGALAINDSGWVVGGDSQNVAIWQNGVAQDLGFEGNATGINASGEIAGFNFGNATVLTQAFLWQNGTQTILPGLGGTSDYANGLNNAGVIVGQSETASGVDEAVMWQNGKVVPLGFFSGEDTANTGDSAAAINNNGQIVGTSKAADGTIHPFIWQNGTMSSLAVEHIGDNAWATGITDSGTVFGYEEPNVYFPGTATAVVWGRNGTPFAMPSLPGYDWDYPNSINQAGLVVGEAAEANGTITFYTYKAVLWDMGQVIDLNSLLPANSGWVLTDATSINDENQIVGQGSFDGVACSFLLTLGSSGAAQIGISASTALAAPLTAPATVIDSAADVVANLDGLEGLAKAGHLGAITLTDSDPPNLVIGPTQAANDAAALADISTGHAVTVRFTGDADQYTVTSAIGGVSVTGNGANSLLSGIMALQFADLTEFVVAAPGPVNAVTTGNLTELYSAVLAREPDFSGLAFYQTYLHSNPSTSLLQFAEWFLTSVEYQTNPAHNYAASTAGDTQFIEDSYQNLLHRTPSSSEVSFYLDNVMNKAVINLVPGTTAYANAQFQAHAQMLVFFSASSEFLSDVEITAQNPASPQHWLILT